MNKPILNIADVDLVPRPVQFAPTGPAADKFEVRTAHLSQQLGAQKLGYNISAVPPGKAAYPFHSHRVNEEMFMVLQGTGQLRVGNEVFPIRQGDVIACPAGGPETAHQMQNTGAEELRYLAVSTQVSPEICEYPDSAKFGVYAILQPAQGGKPQYFYFMGRQDMALDYWHDEGAQPG